MTWSRVTPTLPERCAFLEPMGRCTVPFFEFGASSHGNARL